MIVLASVNSFGSKPAKSFVFGQGTFSTALKGLQFLNTVNERLGLWYLASALLSTWWSVISASCMFSGESNMYMACRLVYYSRDMFWVGSKMVATILDPGELGIHLILSPVMAYSYQFLASLKN